MILMLPELAGEEQEPFGKLEVRGNALRGTGQAVLGEQDREWQDPDIAGAPEEPLGVAARLLARHHEVARRSRQGFDFKLVAVARRPQFG